MFWSPRARVLELDTRRDASEGYTNFIGSCKNPQTLDFGSAGSRARKSLGSRVVVRLRIAGPDYNGKLRIIYLNVHLSMCYLLVVWVYSLTATNAEENWKIIWNSCRAKWWRWWDSPPKRSLPRRFKRHLFQNVRSNRLGDLRSFPPVWDVYSNFSEQTHSARKSKTMPHKYASSFMLVDPEIYSAMIVLFLTILLKCELIIIMYRNKFLLTDIKSCTTTLNSSFS